MFVFQGSVPNKFYVHNDIFRYEDEVFGESEAELDEGEGISKKAWPWIACFIFSDEYEFWL